MVKTVRMGRMQVTMVEVEEVEEVVVEVEEVVVERDIIIRLRLHFIADMVVIMATPVLGIGVVGVGATTDDVLVTG